MIDDPTFTADSQRLRSLGADLLCLWMVGHWVLELHSLAPPTGWVRTSAAQLLAQPTPVPRVLQEVDLSLSCPQTSGTSTSVGPHDPDLQQESSCFYFLSRKNVSVRVGWSLPTHRP